MNYSLAIFLISDEVRGIKVTYEKYTGEHAETQEKHGAYLFKSLDPSLKPGDYVVVETDTRHNMTVCKVVEVDVEPDYDSSHDYKWIIGKVERADFEALEKQEAEAIVKIKSGEKRRMRTKLRKTLLDDVNGDLKALPIYTHQQEEKDDEVPPPAPDAGPEEEPL